MAYNDNTNIWQNNYMVMNLKKDGSLERDLLDT